MKLGLFALAALLLVAGVAVALGIGVTPAPGQASLPAVATVAPVARDTLKGTPEKLAQDSLRRAAEKLTLRVRNISCEGIATGSGFPIDHHTIITNRHVLAGASVLELNTWDGTSLDADVDESSTARLVDIGVTKVGTTLPEVATLGADPKPGQRVTAVGYPLGGELTLSPGRVIGYLDGSKLPSGVAFGGKVMQVSSRIKHGNSGGPLLDSKGRVVGVIFAGEPGATDQDFMKVAYAIPLSSVRTLMQAGGEERVTPCG
ncbi:S1C family serine protease [Solirubrobacter soli]|uniref:S1C family serine protease n=1 Tax=Solirubrobacter soli TaxID=363832 RepID=UPI00040F9D1B|nr:trypsin-like peptidase domain-containing protein [Solirubrobacter soli]